MPDIVVSATVVTTDQPTVVRAVEALARAAAGLALEGIFVSLTIGTVTDEEPL